MLHKVRRKSELKMRSSSAKKKLRVRFGPGRLAWNNLNGDLLTFLGSFLALIAAHSKPGSLDGDQVSERGLRSAMAAATTAKCKSRPLNWP